MTDEPRFFSDLSALEMVDHLLDEVWSAARGLHRGFGPQECASTHSRQLTDWTHKLIDLKYTMSENLSSDAN